MNKTITLLFALMLSASAALAQQPLPYPTDTIDGQVFYKYTPEKSIGLYRISKMFGVSQDDIIRYNPQLEQRGPRLDEILLIPYKKLEQAEKTERIEEPQTKDPAPAPVARQDSIRSLPKADEHLKQNDISQISIFNSIDTVVRTIDTIVRPAAAIRLAMILPLRADAIERDGGDERFFDFYMGSLLAVKQAVDKGISIEMHTYDIEKGSNKIYQLANDSFIRHADAIIGPAYADQVAAIAPIAKADSTWLLIPFTSNVQDIDNNPYIMQFNPTAEEDAETMARYIAGRENDINIVVVEADKDNIPYSIRTLQNKLKEKNIPLTTVTLRQILADSLFTSLSDSAENILLFNTEKYSNLQILMPHIALANQTYLITLMSQYSWQKENIPIGQIYTSVFADTTSTQNTEYQAMWQRYYTFSPHHTLPRYDLLGYDLTSHIISLLAELQDIADDNYKEYLLKRTYNGIQSTIRYERAAENGGYINKGIQIITR